MLDFNVDVSLSVRKIQYPVIFEKHNICIHCGAEGKLIFVDSKNRETNREIYPFDYIKCTACGTNYSILWQRDEDTGRMFPTAVDPSIKQEFLNLVNRKKINQNGIKEI